MGGGVTKIEREDENHERKVSYVSVAIMTRYLNNLLILLELILL